MAMVVPGLMAGLGVPVVRRGLSARPLSPTRRHHRGRPLRRGGRLTRRRGAPRRPRAVRARRPRDRWGQGQRHQPGRVGDEADPARRHVRIGPGPARPSGGLRPPATCSGAPVAAILVHLGRVDVELAVAEAVPPKAPRPPGRRRRAGSPGSMPGVSVATSTAGPSSLSGTPQQRWAAAGGEHVAAVEGRSQFCPGVETVRRAGQLHRPAGPAHQGPPRGPSSPLSGPTSTEAPSADLHRHRPPVGAHPGVDHGQHDAGQQVLGRPGPGPAPRPARCIRRCRGVTSTTRGMGRD